MSRPWLNEYPPGVPPDIDLSGCESLVDMCEQTFARFPERAAFTCMGATLGYAALDAQSAHFAGWLQSRGLRKDSRVALMLPNVLQYPVALIGSLRAGCIVVNVNPLYTARELSQQLIDSGAETIVILENFAATLQKVLAGTAVRHVVVTSMGDMLGGRGRIVDFVVRHVRRLVPAWTLPGHVGWSAALAAGARAGYRPAAPALDDIAVLQYTGGTTGVAKGAILLHRNLLANTIQSEAWLAPALTRRAGAQVITAAALPLYHIFALTVCGFLSIRIGGLAVLIPNPRDIRGLIKTLSAYPVHSFPAVNTLYNALMDHPDFGRLDFSQLLVAVGGGMAVQEAVARRWAERTGRVLVEGYGLSETSPIVSCTPVTATAYSGSVGLPMPSTDVSIRDESGREVPNGETGEVCIRGPQVMAGYWQRPDETDKVMTADGFLRSGDIGRFDAHGNLKLVDRKKDLILVSGFNVYPNEIEDVVASHPGVGEVAAVGINDDKSGEAVKIFVVRRDPGLTETDLRAFCRERLTAYKLPRTIEFREALPKTNVGKILRRALREEGAIPPPTAGG
ncbi:long-chain-fatty-acid--CoA ligase [Robbsia sp. Bb-Pol-6]|uniref:Long-chain-fatty-acid--CoA ligase n=1 Tax=Robbsia betulipollinis TaxID=2981849 RepID=A0ABT3ZRA6_9BURK|nr:long-chain-fatty-acid--CoA ligase [Robbsia betulipollinis]MCY0388957.1 long-chain-fatty-acid--CoA ligase [Robbsia betulipollinis]